MKKILGLLLIGLMFCQPAFAARTSVENIVVSTTLDADPTAASGSKFIGSAEKVGVFVTYDETQVGGISAAVTAQISWDGTTWLSASFYDFAGGATLQTSETLSADGNYYFWLGDEIIAPYLKVIITATGSDADDTAVVAAKLIRQEA
jgi:hypothetical protein